MPNPFVFVQIKLVYCETFFIRGCFRTKATPEKEAFELSLHGILSTKRHVTGLLKRLNELELAQSLYNLLPKSQEIPENTGNW